MNIRCLECGKYVYELRPHLKKHKMTVTEYQEKHNVSVPVPRHLVQKVYIIAENHNMFEMWCITKKIPNYDVIYLSDLQGARGLSPTARILCVGPIMTYRQQDIISMLKHRGCTITIDMEW